MTNLQLRGVRIQRAFCRHGLIQLTVCVALAMTPSVVIRAKGRDTSQALAQKAAEEWLALLDAGKYGESWDSADQGFKQTVTREAWANQLKSRAALGKLVSRKLAKSDLLTNPSFGPPGEYVAIRYENSFENLKSAVELVIPKLNKDGSWRVSNYLIRKNE